MTTIAYNLRVLRGGKQGTQPKRTAEPLTDKELVTRAAKGDSIAFSELVQRHYKRALKVAFGMLKHPHDAQDVAQEAFARVHRRLPEFAGGAAFYTWLYRIVVNLSIDALRKRKRERRADIEDEATRDALESEDKLWPQFDRHDPEVYAARRETASRIEQALAELPEIHQAVLVLRELEGMSYDEIAEVLGVKKGTVMSRLFHARKAMQISLADYAKEQKLGTA